MSQLFEVAGIRPRTFKLEADPRPRGLSYPVDWVDHLRTTFPDLCRRQWGEASVYYKPRRRMSLSSKRIYLLLDEGTLTFNSDPSKVSFTADLSHRIFWPKYG